MASLTSHTRRVRQYQAVQSWGHPGILESDCQLQTVQYPTADFSLHLDSLSPREVALAARCSKEVTSLSSTWALVKGTRV